MLQRSEDSTARVVAPAAAPRDEGVEVEASFLSHVLSPYAAKNCIYLTSARNYFDSHLATRATFLIPESCYIDSTGHFNAVELNICCNQMFYVLMADGVRRGKAKEFAGWSIDDFKQQQLPSMFIVRIQSDFKRPIDPTNFYCDAHVERIIPLGGDRQQAFHIRTQAKFQDASGGLATGQIDFAVVPTV